MSAEGDPSGKQSDMLYVHSPSEKGDSFKVVRMRPDSVEVGEIRGMEEGRPIHGEVVKLTPRPEHKQLFDVDVLVPGPKSLAQVDEHQRGGGGGEGDGRSGPAQVATEAYRENWMTIFGSASRGARGSGGSGGSGEEPN